MQHLRRTLKLDAILAAVAQRPVFAYSTFYDPHLGCGCFVGQLALASGFPLPALTTIMTDAQTDAARAERSELLNGLYAHLEATYGLPEWVLDFMFDLNDAVVGETPTQRYERVVATFPKRLDEWEKTHQEQVTDALYGDAGED